MFLITSRIEFVIINRLIRRNIFFLFFICVLFFCSFCVLAKTERNIGMEKMNVALGEMSRKNYKKALEMFLECFDNARKYEATFMAVKNSFLILYLERMIKNYPPTRKALNYRYTVMKKKVELGGFQKQEVNSTFELARILGKKKEIVPIYDIAKKNIKKRSELKFLTHLFYSVLYPKGRFRDIYNNMDLIDSINSTIGKFKKMTGVMQEYSKNMIIRRFKEYRNVFKQVSDKKKMEELDKIYKEYKLTIKNN